jgi:transforming growth factor-beta-induced protein
MTQLLGRIGYFAAICTALVATACASDDDSTDAMANTGGTSMGAGGSSTGGTSSAIGGQSSTAPQSGDIVATAIAAGSFTKLAAALNATGLTAALKGTGPFTVFAPTDAAFAAFEAANPGVLSSLSTDELSAILKYHVIAGKVMSKDLVSGSLAETLNGSRVAVDLSSGATVAGSKVIQADVAASNGVIHVIDKIMLPPSKDIVGTAVAAGGFTKLAGALIATGLDKTLQGEGPFTVFAPTDDAFAAFEAAHPGVLSSLTTPQLSDILLYHVAPGWAGAADLKNGDSVSTALTGKSLKVSTTAGVKVNDSKVTSANIVTTNGVIHVIDAVLLPPND